MTDKKQDDLFYVCSLIEFIGRKTKNRRGVVVEALGDAGVKKQLHDAAVNHCLSFEQVSDEVIEGYHIFEGTYDTISECKYKIPSVMAIGKLYTRILLACAESDKEEEELVNIFKSFISDEISDFKTGVYFENISYLQASYKAGCLL